MLPQAPITVVIGHFDDLFAGGLRELIEKDASLAVVAADVEHRRIGVVLSFRTAAGFPGTRLVLFGDDPTPVECAQVLAFGASACLSRDTQSRDVINAIHLASRGLQLLPRTAGSDSARVAAGGLLTRREAEVLPLLQQGYSNARIALALHVGVETVRTHARNIYRKLGVSSRRDLAARPALEAEPPRAQPEHSARRVTVTRLAGRRRGRGTRHA